MNRKLVIISGVTGAIGNSLLAKYAREENTIVYGISRKARPLKDFIDPKTKKIFDSTLIFSLEKMDEKNYFKFINLIDFSKFFEVNYVHALGVYPFEIDETGEYIVENDGDKDGINDLVKFLSYDVFRFLTKKIISSTKIQINIGIFGSLADKHKPLAHKSWWKIFEKTKKYMKSVKKENVSMHVFNISSVACSHEILTRPFVFIKTDADPRYWLSSEEVTRKVFEEFSKRKNGYFEHELFHIKPEFDKEYYVDKKFTPRKVNELFSD